MAKLTENEITAMVVKRSRFENGKWVVLVEDTDKHIYRVSFDGAANDTDEVLLGKIHDELILTDKYVRTTYVDNTITRDCLHGQNPCKN